MITKFTISAGDRPILKDTLVQSGTDTVLDLAPGAESDSSPVDLTGCTVKLLFQGAGQNYAPSATITDPANGRVQYQFAAGQTAAAGIYRAEWQITDAGGITTTACPFQFEIKPALPVSQSSQFSLLSDLFPDIRVLVGDYNKRVYQDGTIMDQMKTVLRSRKVKDPDTCKFWSVGADGLTINPAIGNDEWKPYSLLVYHTALALVTPNLAAYSYRTRSMSERFGEQRDFLAELKNFIHDIENGEAIEGTITGMRASLFAVNGIWVWSYLQAEQNINLSLQ